MARITVLDDEKRLLKTLGRFLENAGHEVRCAERLELIEQELVPGSFDVLITDILMPGKSGIEILKSLTQEGCQEPIILMTGEPDVESASLAVRLGAFDYITKPVTKIKLLDTVSRALRHVDLLRERDRARSAEMALLKNLAQIGEEAAVLVHEVKTPITNLNQALRAVADKLDIEQDSMLRELVGKLQRIERLLNGTLSFAKPLELSCALHSFADFLDQVEGSFKENERFAHFAIERELPDEGIEIYGDLPKLEEVFVNLIQNAAEACKFDGRVRVSALQRSGRLEILVEDDGPGFSPEQAGQVFKLFYSSKESGTGLGLPIVRKIIESHKGSIRVRKGRLAGACFEIVLPGRDGSFPNEEAHQPKSSEGGQP